MQSKLVQTKDTKDFYEQRRVLKAKRDSGENVAGFWRECSGILARMISNSEILSTIRNSLQTSISIFFESVVSPPLVF